ncbi:MAG TPA: bifunctional histidinol-phosphatase/imidazoleglycerol-phosphate dehydratase HisB [Candidatus Anaerobiospirillum pullistercoris]|uniref:Histidine biosynthesis bifunctional protein HisB n=1 Tax=Candidatus Anaerobiospirillum pullistercoris TaxID=2838452 RepID=A0A9D1WB31_9GAMM|nr:bifunctional histidinol-phosphatase/imidazoleglycerol-phosphate dehydratase HisB [Candidatus Anaerobiospirillum pullistercoris]
MKKYLFIDRDGTLVYEPEDYQVDALSKIKFLPRVIPALLHLQDLGYSLIMVSNQDGLGTESFPLDTFTPAHEFILNTLESQGISFEQVLICPHKPEDNCACRKPKLGLVQAYMDDLNWDREHSYFIGDRDTDMQMAQNMGITGLRVRSCDEDNDADNGQGLLTAIPEGLTWDEIATKISIALNATPKQDILSLATSEEVGNETTDLPCAGERAHRVATVERNTKETQISVRVDLDQVGGSSIHTGIGFFNHMLDQIATHAGFNLQVLVRGDLEVDGHHTIEDTAIALGTALKEALGDKRGIGRFGFVLPMDEVMAKVFGAPNVDIFELSVQGKPQGRNSDRDDAQQVQNDKTITVALDISGRPHVEFDFHADFTRDVINGFETQMVSHFFESLAVAMGLTLHMSVTHGNAHHQVEALFKAFGRALRPAIKVVSNELPSSKGTL